MGEVLRLHQRKTFSLVILSFLLGVLSMFMLSMSSDFWHLDPWDLSSFFKRPTAEIDPETEFPYRPPVAWDISQDHPRKFTYTVDEISWANVDLSPDGSTILFDVLGDLYTVPVSGGKATRLLGGVPYDRQARFSPDGTKVLYTSDASGCDNLWVLDVATKSTFQVTNEPYRFVSNAFWAPNGTTVVGVKWYTSERSIGAGEIWTFNYSPQTGPDVGVRVVGRPSFENQIGPEEPIFSRDGRRIYYSKNTADGSVFEYSKDPHKGIYTIFEFEVSTGTTSIVTGAAQTKKISSVTGTTRTISGGAGGSARPVLSNDGKSLAFVRRTLFNNSLVIRDLESGNEKVIYSGLSPDQQASSAPSGVYPSFSWLKGDQEIILWSFGKIRRVNVNTGKATEIPISVDIDLDLAETVRPSTDPSTGSSFTTKVVQGASRSRTTVLFTTLGRSYYLPLSGGTPQLVTKNRNTNEEFEFGASFSPSGFQGVHVVWSDTQYARVELFTLDGSSSPITLTTEIGRYVYPSFSLSGSSVVFSRIGGDTLSGPLYGQKAGIYIVNLNIDKETGLVTGVAGPPTYVTSGYQATFTNDGLSLVVQRDYQAVQVFLDGTTPERVLATGPYCTSISVSSDLALVAFIDFYELYVAPLRLGPNGEPMQLLTKPGYTPEGLRRLSPNGGEFFIWPPEGGVKSLSYLLGSVLYTVIPDDIASCEASEENNYGVDCVKSRTSAIDLSLTVPTNIPQTSVVFDNAVLVTMEGSESSGIIQNGRIVILGDKIQALGSRDQIQIPPGAQVIDVNGGVVMPGYIDTHAHWSSAFGYYVHQSWEYLVNLAFGVTTMHNPSYDTVYGFSDAELVRSGLKIGPRIFSTGTIVYGAGGPYRCEIEDLDAARAALRRLKSYGAFSVKSYNQPCRSSRQMILEAAKELNMAVVPEGGMSYYWNLNQVIDGHTTIEHALPVAPLYKDVIELFAQSGTGYTPTLIVAYGGLWGENYWYQNTNVWENSRLGKFSPRADIEARSVQRPKAEDEDYNHFDVARSAKAINDRGGLTEAGAHGQRQGIGIHWELWMFSQGGMSNYNVLKTGTINGALALGFSNLGKLAPGYLADIIVYPPESSPLSNIRNTENVKYVLKDGRLYEAATMDQILPTAQPLPQGPIINIPSNN